MRALWTLGEIVMLLTGCTATAPIAMASAPEALAALTRSIATDHRPALKARPRGSTVTRGLACGSGFEDVVRCEALLSFGPHLRAYLVDIPVSQANDVAGALAAYYFLEDRIETSSKLPDYGKTWAVLTMRHEFMHALSWKMPGYREDAPAEFPRLRAAIAAADGERHAFIKYDQWLRAHAEYVADLPHFITGIVEVMRPGELPASLESYFAPMLESE